jgi:hypothetical protein
MLREFYCHRISVAQPLRLLSCPPFELSRPIQIRNSSALDYTRHRLAASELRSLSELRQRGDDGWLQDSPDFCQVDELWLRIELGANKCH